MGPFETIELNAPGGIADYCARYTGFYRSASPPTGDPGERSRPSNVARILARLGAARPAPDEIARKSAWRDRRLAALRRTSARSPKP